ncbi:hypothetical protein PFISCL1PPCAC_2571, partial [Pristionchus fissidentatus]
FYCLPKLDSFCDVVKGFGAPIFASSSPVNNQNKFANFVDSEPLGLGMKELFDSCDDSRGLAVDCHNSVTKCLQGEHERIKRAELSEEIVHNSFQDCRATMFDCLQCVIEANENDKCTSIARSMSTSINIYMELLSETHGQSIIDVYPIVSSRVLKQCNQSTVELVSCMQSFDVCAKE